MRSIISFIVVVLLVIWLFDVRLNTCNCSWDIVFKYSKNTADDMCKKICENTSAPWYTGILNTF